MDTRVSAFGLGPDLTQLILVGVMVNLSASIPDWYRVLTSASSTVKAQVDRLLRDPAVLASVTLWDFCEVHSSLHLLRQHSDWLMASSGDALSQVTELTIRARPGPHTSNTGYLLYGHPCATRFRSLQHLRLQGPWHFQVWSYLMRFRQSQPPLFAESRLTHVTLINYRFAAVNQRLSGQWFWPRKVTLLSPAFSTTHSPVDQLRKQFFGRHLPQVIEMGPASDAGLVRVFEEFRTACQKTVAVRLVD